MSLTVELNRRMSCLQEERALTVVAVCFTQILTECDDGVRKMRHIEELVCLAPLIDFGKVKVTLTVLTLRCSTVFILSQSRQMTNCGNPSSIQAVPLIVGGRFLVHQGPVRQLIVETTYNSKGSLIDLYLHLFNDLLIISTKRYLTFSLQSY